MYPMKRKIFFFVFDNQFFYALLKLKNCVQLMFFVDPFSIPLITYDNRSRKVGILL